MSRPKGYAEVSPRPPATREAPKKRPEMRAHGACGEVRRGRSDLPGMTPLSRRPPKNFDILNYL